MKETKTVWTKAKSERMSLKKKNPKERQTSEKRKKIMKS